MRSIVIAGAVFVAAVTTASAEEITLRAVSAFAEGTEFSRNFERFVEKVNADGKGLIKINYIGGPRAVPPFEVGNAVRTRVVDMANVTGAVYTALERGVADGYGWPITGIFDLGWDKVTKFRMEPPFYSVEVNVLVNLDAWKGLSDAQRKLLNDAALWLEGLDSEKEADIKAERERQSAAGIQPLDFGPAASKAFLDRAYEVSWQSVIKRAPDTGPKLRQLAGN